MRAHEILEADNLTQAQQMPTMKDPKLLVSSGYNDYYELSPEDFQIFKNWLGVYSPADKKYLNKIPAGARYFVVTKVEEDDRPDLKTWPRYSRFAFYYMVDDKLHQPISGWGPDSLGPWKKFLKIIGAQQSVWNDYYHKRLVLRSGQLLKNKDALETLKIGNLQDGTPVYQGDKWDTDILWKYAKEFVPDGGYFSPGGKLFTTIDHIVRLDNPVVGSQFIWIKDGQIVRATWDKDRLAASIKAIREFSNKFHKPLAIKLPTPKAKDPRWVKPGSNFHKMLAYVNTHPGCSRSDWYVKHLGNDPQGMPGWQASTAWDGLAANAGLINNNSKQAGKYSLEITTPGSMVLAMLNNGQKVDINALEDL